MRTLQLDYETNQIVELREAHSQRLVRFVNSPHPTPAFSGLPHTVGFDWSTCCLKTGIGGGFIGMLRQIKQPGKQRLPG